MSDSWSLTPFLFALVGVCIAPYWSVLPSIEEVCYPRTCDFVIIYLEVFVIAFLSTFFLQLWRFNQSPSSLLNE